jgi:hypothetical protein
MGEAHFAGDQRLHDRRRAADLDVLQVEAMFFEDAVVDRYLNMIRGTADVCDADLGERLGVEKGSLVKEKPDYEQNETDALTKLS